MEIQSLSAISHLLAHRPHRVQRLLVRSSKNSKANARVDSLCQLARQHKIPVDKYHHQGPEEDSSPLKAIIEEFEYTSLETWVEAQASKKSSLLVALDHVQDPQNFGAICRTAEGLGIDGVLIPKDRGATVSPGVYAASVGAVETLPVLRPVNLGESLRKLKENGFWIVGAAQGPDAKPPWETPTFEKIVLVLGAEGEGMSDSIRKLCDWLVEVPIAGSIESLNVSVAGALLMYELSRPGRPFQLGK